MKHAKGAMSTASRPMTEAQMEAEMLRHRAEGMVRDAMGKAPGYAREVERVMRELKAVERGVAKRIKGAT